MQNSYLCNTIHEQNQSSLVTPKIGRGGASHPIPSMLPINGEPRVHNIKTHFPRLKQAACNLKQGEVRTRRLQLKILHDFFWHHFRRLNIS